MNKSKFLTSASVITFLATASIITFLVTMNFGTRVVLAKSGGISGYSTAGCTCHSSNPSPSVSVQISGRTIVMPSATYTYTITVTGGPLLANGLDVSVTDGTLVATDLTNTQLLDGEIVQTEAGMSQTSWSFDWTAPSTYGNADMYMAGFSGDGDGRKDADDLWNTVSLTMIVTIPGDVDGDFDVDPDDFYIFAGAYGTSPPSDPNCDLDDDGDVDPDDFYIFAGNYGKSI